MGLRLKEFGQNDVGCHIDGASGQEHQAERLGQLLVQCDEAVNHPYYDSDDGQWWTDATEALQDHTEEGLYWTWEAGDLILSGVEVTPGTNQQP